MGATHVPGKASPLPKGYFVSAVMMSPTFYRTKREAFKVGREVGGFVFRICECGCGNPAGKAMRSFSNGY
jgi:hypothetical protein